MHLQCNYWNIYSWFALRYKNFANQRNIYNSKRILSVVSNCGTLSGYKLEFCVHYKTVKAEQLEDIKSFITKILY